MPVMFTEVKRYSFQWTIQQRSGDKQLPCLCWPLTRQAWHWSTTSFISVESLGHQTDELTLSLHLVRPWCPSCSLSRMAILCDFGIKILPRMTRPSASYSLFFTFMYALMFGGRLPPYTPIAFVCN